MVYTYLGVTHLGVVSYIVMQFNLHMHYADTLEFIL